MSEGLLAIERKRGSKKSYYKIDEQINENDIYTRSDLYVYAKEITLATTVAKIRKENRK